MPAFTLDRIDDMLKPATKYIYDKKNNQLLDYPQLKSFIEKAIGAPNPNEIAKQYTINMPALAEFLIKIHPLLKERSIEIRLRKLYRKMTQDPADPSASNWSSEADKELSN